MTGGGRSEHAIRLRTDAGGRRGRVRDDDVDSWVRCRDLLARRCEWFGFGNGVSTVGACVGDTVGGVRHGRRM